MSTTSTATSPLQMKLLIDTEAKRVVFAEASKEVINLLFAVPMPVGMLVRMMSTGYAPGSFGNLYWSVEHLDDADLLRGAKKKKKTVLKPAADGGSGAANGGLVPGVVTYALRDDLTVAPMSTISGTSMLNAAALQEKTVPIGYAEGRAILKASLQSETPLTDVFLSNKRHRGGA